MTHVLVISVRLHDARWHGAGEWPPAPARLFQALVAGEGAGGALADRCAQALRWFETLRAPVIATPGTRKGQGYTNFVPNNDLDAVGGDPDRVAEIRTGKTIRPRLIDGEPEFRFAWTLDSGTDHANAQVICQIAQGIYQFGRGVDMAWATAEVLSPDEAEARLVAHPGQIWRPSGEAATGGVALRCPAPGTLQSLIDRHAEQRRRIAGGVFRKPREARFRLVGYNCPPDRLLLELKPADDGRRFQPWPLDRAAGLTTMVRDAAAGRLATAGVGSALVERYVVGRGANGADIGRRVRIIPLPSIGHAMADPSIRRVLVERPSDCPIPARALEFAVSNLDLAPLDAETGEVLAPAAPVLAPAENKEMLGHYGIGARRASRVWCSVTPLALPVIRRRGKIIGSERVRTETAAALAVCQALRHAGVATAVESICVQREPFFGKGARAEAFALPPRFPAGRLWHVRLAFATSVEGPLVIGDGRYLGLGLMRAETDALRDALILTIDETDRPPVAHRATVVLALRRALMSLARDGEGRIPTLFSGHENDPGPAASGQHRHVYLFTDDSDGDGLLDRLGIIAPWMVDRSTSARTSDSARFEKVVSRLQFLRLNDVGCLTLTPPCAPARDDPLFTRASMWTSHTPYRPTRHAHKGADPKEFVRTDLATECLRRGLPKPGIEVQHLEAGPRGGLQALVRLTFTVTTAGPILLGRDAHRGGGQFAASGR